MSERKPLSRRHFLKGTLLGLGVAGAPMLLAACGGTPEPAANNATSAPVGTNATTAPATDAATSAPEAATSAVEPTAVQAAESVDVTLRLTKTDNMVGPIPTQDEQDADALMFGHAIAMQEWLDRNPGVKVEAIDRIEDPQAFRTALVAGTGPSVFGFANAGRRNAIAQNIVAEVTDLVKQYEIEQNLMDFALPLYQAEQFSGKYYSVPGSITAGQGIFYRRDIIQEKGLEEPKLGWTWDDLRTLAKALTDDKMKGIALDSWAIGAAINANMSESLLSKVPAPSTGWNWKYDFTTNAADWEKSITRYRAMIDEDQSVITAQDKGWGSFQAVDQGAAAMGNGGQFVFSWGFANIAKELGKPADEVIGYAPWPNGDRGNTNEMSRPEVLTSAFSVDLDSAGLAKIFDLFNYMVYGEGFTRKRVEAYNKSKDPAFAYDSRVPLAKNWAGQIGDIKGSVAEAVGPKFIETLNQMMTIPAVPQEALFLPGEETAGPSRDAWNQATNGWTFGADKAVGKYDVAADLKTLEETMNQQANGFTSSIDDAEFTEAAKKYYAAHDAFWKENAPKFHEEVYSPWYNEKVLPELGG